jgi:hypothetical protein
MPHIASLAGQGTAGYTGDGQIEEATELGVEEIDCRFNKRHLTVSLGTCPMADLKNPAVIWTKGFLFLATGLLASVLIVLRAPSITIVVLLCLSVWAFCRFYYFAFYVIEHYVDSTYRFSGLLAFFGYAWRKWRG